MRRRWRRNWSRACVPTLAPSRTRRALIVERLPKTRSGKILRTALRRLAAGDHVDPPSTIDDPAILPEIAALRSAGIPG